MVVPCHVKIDGAEYKPRAPYTFAVLPRIGEIITLEWDGDRFPEFEVYAVFHVPDGVEDKPAFTVLHVRKADRR
jgi:hypothetical protein